MNHTTLGLLAVLAAATLVIATLAAAPAFAKSIGDGNTITKQKNKAKAIASGFATTAANLQQNAICVVVTTLCV